jgi:hypothetical protein
VLDDDECRSVTMEAGEKKDGSERRLHPFLQGRRKDGPRKNFLQIQGCATRWRVRHPARSTRLLLSQRGQRINPCRAASWDVARRESRS